MIRLTLQQRDAIIAHAQKALPEECCGILVGRREGENAIVTAVEPSANTWDGDRHSRFMLDALTHLRVQRQARTAGLDIVGFYHSHPHSPPIPSRFDREMAWPAYSYLILSLDTEPPETRSWQLADDDAEFCEEPVKTDGGESPS